MARIFRWYQTAFASVSDCVHEGTSSICATAHLTSSAVDDNHNTTSTDAHQFVLHSGASQQDEFSGARATPTHRPFGRQGHTFYSFPQGFYQPNYTTPVSPTSAIPHSHSDSFNRNFAFDPSRYFLPDNITQRQNTQPSELNTGENRDNFRNFVLSGIHQHLYLVNNNVMQFKSEGSVADKQEASSTANCCPSLASPCGDPYKLPGCTCTYTSGHIRRNQTEYKANGERPFASSGKSKSKSAGSLKSTFVDSGKASSSRLSPHDANCESASYKISSQMPSWQAPVKDKALNGSSFDKTHRLSSASETDTENGVNYHIETYHTDLDMHGSDAGDISAFSTSSQDSDLCSCGKLGLNHSHTNCSNLSTRGSSKIPSDVSSYDSNVYRSQSPTAELGRFSGEVHVPTGFPVSNPSVFEDNLLMLPNRVSEKHHSWGVSTKSRLFLPHSLMPTPFSQNSIAFQDDVRNKEENLNSHTTELQTTSETLAYKQTPAKGCSAPVEFGPKPAAFDQHASENNTLASLMPSATTSDRSSLASVPKLQRRDHKVTAKYSRDSDLSLSSPTTCGLSPFVSDWCPSGSESCELSCTCETPRSEQISDCRNLTRLTSRTIPIIPCSCASSFLSVPFHDGRYVAKCTETGNPFVNANSCLAFSSISSDSKNRAMPLGQNPAPDRAPQSLSLADCTCPGHTIDHHSACLPLVRLSNLQGTSTQKDQKSTSVRIINDLDAGKNLHSGFCQRPQEICEWQSVHPDSQQLGLHLHDTELLCNVPSVDDEHLRTVATGAADELADVHDIHSFDEVDSSSDSSKETPETRKGTNRKTSAGVELKDTVVTLQASGM